MNAKKLVKESKKRIEKSEWFLSFPKNERIKKKDGQYDYYVTDKNGIRDKLSKKEIFLLKKRLLIKGLVRIIYSHYP